MRIVKNIFEPKASRILRILLLNPGRAWTIRELASEAQVAYGYVHAVVAALSQSGYVLRNQVNRLEMADPIRVLKRWAAYHQYDAVNTIVNYYTFEREVDRVIQTLRGKTTDYALTGLSGAWLMAPQVRPVAIDTYVRNEGEAKKLAEDLLLKLIPKEGNVRLVIPCDEGVFYRTQEIDGVRVVSNVQLYVDLLNHPMRGEEAAAPIMTLIEKAWSQALLEERSNV